MNICIMLPSLFIGRDNSPIVNMWILLFDSYRHTHTEYSSNTHIQCFLTRVLFSCLWRFVLLLGWMKTHGLCMYKICIQIYYLCECARNIRCGFCWCGVFSDAYPPSLLWLGLWTIKRCMSHRARIICINYDQRNRFRCQMACVCLISNNTERSNCRRQLVCN